MKKQNTKGQNTGRRDLLKMAAVGAVAAAGGTAASTVALAHETGKTHAGSGYRLTDHVKAYYKSARF